MDNEQKDNMTPPPENSGNENQIPEPVPRQPMSTEEKLATSPAVVRPSFQDPSSSAFINSLNQTSQEDPLAAENLPAENFNPESFAASPEMFTDNVDKKESKLIKFIRILVWLAIAIALPIGISLKKSAALSTSLADGTYKIFNEQGKNLMTIFLILGGLNLIWGLIRWVARIRRERCTVGCIIGKLIGGGIWRTLIFTPIILASFLFLATSVREAIKTNVQDSFAPPSSSKITLAYEKGDISSDEYVSNLLLASFDQESLAENYQGSAEPTTPDFARLVEENYDSLSDETKLLFYEIFSLSHVDFDLDASGNEDRFSPKMPTPQSQNTA